MTVFCLAHRCTLSTWAYAVLGVALCCLGLTSAPAAQPTTAHRLRVVTHAGYLPQLPLLIRVELLDASGQPDRNVWDATATLSEDSAGVTLSTNRILLRNGLGTAPITISGSGDFTLTVTVGPVQESRPLRDLSGISMTQVGGTLTGTATTWSGIVNVTNDLTVPMGHTLTIESNTLVLVNGVASGTVAPDLLIAGTIQSLGTETNPVTITCANAGLRWGQIRHTTAQPSLYRYTTIMRTGRAPGEGHTGTGPAVRPSSSQITFRHCNITDAGGKIMQASGSDLVMDSCVLARAVMGPEIGSTGLLCTNTYIMEMSSNDDGDGIYLHSSGGRLLKMTHCVVAGLSGLTDDGIDTLDANVTIEDTIIRDWFHPADDPKGISAFNGEVRVTRCIIQDCLIGLSAKSYAPPSKSRVFIESSTIRGTTNSVAAAYKSNAAGPDIGIFITNSIIRSVDALRSDFSTELTNFTLGYCNASEPFGGTGNFTNDAAFVDAPNHDYHLAIGSPCIDTGNPNSPLDPDGSVIDVGCFTFQVPPPVLSAPNRLPNGSFEFVLSAYTNRNYVIEYSTNALAWGTLDTIMHATDPRIINDSTASDRLRLYRARLGP
jgi:hypothetical protein